MIVEMLFGSHLYGTNTEKSDKDYKGIFLPTLDDCILKKIPKSINTSTGKNNSKNTNEDVDKEIFSLQQFIKLALEGQTIAIDMIHAPQNMIIESNWIWDEIVANREKFYTKNLKAFIGYARRQASKYGTRGSRLESITKFLNFLTQYNEDMKLQTIWDRLPKLKHTHFIDDKDNKFYQICGKSFQSTVKVGYVIPIIETFISEYGDRARAAKNNENIDWKACSHAMRAAIQIKELLTDNIIIFPLKDAKYLTDIKNGLIDYTEYANMLEEIIEEVEALALKSDLPEKADREYWENFIVDVYNVERKNFI